MANNITYLNRKEEIEILRRLLDKVNELGKKSIYETTSTITILSISLTHLIELIGNNKIFNEHPEVEKLFIVSIFRTFDINLMIAIEIHMNIFLSQNNLQKKLKDKIDIFFHKLNIENSEKWKEIVHFLRILRNTTVHPDFKVKGQSNLDAIHKIIKSKTIKHLSLIDNKKIVTDLEYFPEIIKLVNQFQSLLETLKKRD